MNNVCHTNDGLVFNMTIELVYTYKYVSYTYIIYNILYKYMIQYCILYDKHIICMFINIHYIINITYG